MIAFVVVPCTDRLVANAKMCELYVSHAGREEIVFMVGEDRASKAIEKHRHFNSKKCHYRLVYSVP